DAEDAGDHADRGLGHARDRLAARQSYGHSPHYLSASQLDRRQLHRGGRDGRAGPGTARAREHRGVDRAQEASPAAGGDRTPDEALHVLRRCPRSDAGGDARDHDQNRVILMSERRLPPFTEVAMASLGLIVAGGIYLSAHIPQHVPLTPAIILLAASALLMVGNFASLARVPGFAWDRFAQVGKWSLLAYLVISGLIQYTFLQN